MGLYVISWPISVLMMERIFVFFLIINVINLSAKGVLAWTWGTRINNCCQGHMWFWVATGQEPPCTEHYPASIATLAQRWPNVNPYVGPTSAHQRWANVDLSIEPTLAQRWDANVGPTLCQHRPNVGTLTLGQRWHNVTPMVVCQHCTNIGPTEAALLAFCEGNPSVTDRSPVEQTVELSNQWFETPMWSTSM